MFTNSFWIFTITSIHVFSKSLQLYYLQFQTPFGLAVIDVEYDQEEFEKKLKDVEKNYYGSYLVEFFEKRTPRNLDSITVY